MQAGTARRRIHNEINITPLTDVFLVLLIIMMLLQTAATLRYAGQIRPPQVDGAYYALPYNPYGRREDYAWSFPARWFDMKRDQVVLIGDEFWEKIGGLGTYQSFVSAVNEIGETYKDRIYREYLGIEPPPRIEQAVLR